MVWGGAGFFYGGRSVWPGAANAVQQVSTTAGDLGTDVYSSVGAEIYVRRLRWLFGAGASALATKRLQDRASQLSVESSASNAHAWVGWVSWQSKRAKLYPGIGPGINSFTVDLTTPGNTATMYAVTGFATDISLTYDWLVLKSGTGSTLQAGPMLSIRVGYRLTTATANWQTDQNRSPVHYTPQCFFVTLGLGGGGFRNQ
ncbi:hypothetical protein GCM10028810_37220 [Spirosoma litoris]